ncbi:MAG: tetratricopeptide repeat protein [Saprospiraceae bacterium]|nr:tetratricopeptide repeat protein [Saprospiraceae bacterium]
MKKQNKTNIRLEISKNVRIDHSIGAKEPKFSLISIIIVIAITTFVFVPSLNNGFVNWDDDRNVYENKTLEGPLNTKQFTNIFTTPVIGNYNPLSIASFAVEKHFFGMNPKAMHTTNLLLHLFCVWMVYLIFLRLGLNSLYAALAALLFGIHPLRVESVAWITERKDVLFASFYLPALYLYIRNLETPSFKRSVFIYILFSIGLFAKIQMVALPLTFLMIDYWKGRNINYKLLLEKSHFWLTALAFGILGIYFLKKEGSLDANQVHDGINRIFIGTYSLITYIIKWIIPYRILPLYPYPEKMTIWHYLSFIPVVLLIAGLYYSYKNNLRAVLFGFGFFLVNIVFLLQILGAGQGYLADRFTYIAYIGLFFIFSYYIQEWIIKNPATKNSIHASIIIYLIYLSYLSYKQNFFWKDSGSMWSRVIEFYNNTPLPFNNRANFYRDAKLYDQAMKDYNRAIQLKADHPTYNSRAKLFFEKNEDEKAIADYNIAIQKKPTAEYFVNRGAAFAKLGRLNEAIQDFNKGLAMDPSWKVGYLNRSIMYQFQGNFQAALDDINSYVRLDPYNADIWYEGGRCSRAVQKIQEAIRYYDEAIKLNPKLGIAYLERGRTYQQLGNMNAANADLQKARSLGEKVEPVSNFPVR